MPPEIRLTSPKNIQYLWHSITENQGQQINVAPLNKVTKYLASYFHDQAEDLIKNAIHDGVVISGKSPNSIKTLKIPTLDDFTIEENSHDWYCFECHNPPGSSSFQHCLECLRSFHKKCWRLDPDKPNNADTVVPKRRLINQQTISNEHRQSCNDFLQITLEAERQDETLSVTPTEAAATAKIDNEQLNQENTSSTVVDDSMEEKKPILLTSVNNIDVKNELINDTNDGHIAKPLENEIICIGEVRPPSRKRRENRSLSCKPENDDATIEQNENERDLLLCSCCRLKKLSKLRDPPNITNKETNYLLRFVYERIKSWIALDTFSTVSKSNSWGLPSKKHLEIFMKLCFKHVKSLSIINKKLKREEYSTLTEFQCDFMDVQHCIGILYGTESTECSSSNYLLSDCNYDLSEIRQCRDCYRNSNQKSDPYWFCKPCVPRHELVFAKQTGFSHWPAKVVRVFDNQYDVRFFGGNHSRAVVFASNVKSIDTDIDELKIKKSKTFNYAMSELHKHQELLNLLPGQFSFITDVENMSGGGGGTTAIAATIDNSANNFKQSSTMVINIKKMNLATEKKQRINGDINATVSVSASPPVTISQSNAVASKKRKRKLSCNQSEIMHENLENNANVNAATAIINNVVLPSTKKLKISAKNKSARKSISALETTATTATTESLAAAAPTTSGNEELLVSSLTQKISTQHREEIDDDDDDDDYTLTSSAVEKLRHKFSTVNNAKTCKKIAFDILKSEISNWQTKILQLKEKHEKKISSIKKQSWCIYCEKPAIYHCCWNTNYCTQECQSKHWKEHKTECKHGKEFVTMSNNEEKLLKTTKRKTPHKK